MYALLTTCEVKIHCSWMLANFFVCFMDQDEVGVNKYWKTKQDQYPANFFFFLYFIYLFIFFLQV